MRRKDFEETYEYDNRKLKNEGKYHKFAFIIYLCMQ